MRASQGIPHGPKARPYNPKLFQNHEEVIVYEREEFRRNYNQIRDSINHIIMTDLCLDRDEHWKLMGHWPLIMERIHFINQGLNSFLTEKPKQCYLDTYLHSPVNATNHEIRDSVNIPQIESMALDWLQI